MTDASGLVQHLGYVDSLNVTVSICLTYTLIVSCIRVYLRRGGFGSDDAVLLLATIIALVHFAIDYASLSAGLGKPYDMLGASLGRLSSIALASAITFIIGLYVSKIAALVFLMRIESKTQNPRLHYGLVCLWIVFGIGSLLCVTVACPSSSGYYWNLVGNKDSCSSQWTRWQVMTVLDVISEVVLLALPIHLVWRLQMPMDRKITVIATFWTRIPIIGLSVVRQHYMGRLRQASTDVSLGSTIVVILTEVELSYAIIACTLSTSKSSVDSFNTGWGMGHIRGAADSYNMSNVGGSGGQSTANKSTTRSSTNAGTYDYSMPAPMGRSKKTAHRQTPSYEYEEEQGLQLGPRPGVESHTEVHSGRGHWIESESVSSEPDDLVIVRQTEYTVSHDKVPMLSKHVEDV